MKSVFESKDFKKSDNWIPIHTGIIHDKNENQYTFMIGKRYLFEDGNFPSLTNKYNVGYISIPVNNPAFNCYYKNIPIKGITYSEFIEGEFVISVDRYNFIKNNEIDITFTEIREEISRIINELSNLKESDFIFRMNKLPIKNTGDKYFYGSYKLPSYNEYNKQRIRFIRFTSLRERNLFVKKNNGIEHAAKEIKRLKKLNMIDENYNYVL